MGLRFDPIGGGQFKQAVKSIIEAESQPIKQLEVHKAQEEAKMKLFQEFRSKFTNVDKALGDLTSFSKFRELKADLGDGTNFASVTIDKEKAQPGSYSLRIDDLAARTSIISNGFSSADENVLGIGFVVMKSPEGGTSEIYVGEENANLHGVATLINQQSDAPVRAAVVKDASDLDSPWKLIVTAKKDGAGNQVDFPDFYFLDGEKDLYIEDHKDAHNAIVQMNGFPIELESNEMNEFLPGVNLHLKQANPDKPFTLNITEDTQKVSGKVKNLVEQLNGVLDFVNKQNQIDEKSDTRNTFAGDTSLQGMEYRIRNLLHEGFSN